MARRSASLPRDAILIFILGVFLSDSTSGLPMRTSPHPFESRDVTYGRPRLHPSTYSPYVADTGYNPYGSPSQYHTSTKSRIPPIGLPVNEDPSEPFVLLPTGESIPYALYESCVACYERRLPMTVITANGDVIPVSSFTEVLLITKGKPDSQVRLSNGGAILSASTLRAVIRGYLDDTIEIHFPQEEVTLEKVSEPTVILSSGEQLPYTEYESIVKNFEKRTPMRVATPKGEKRFRGLTEFILVTQNRPYDLVFLEDGEVVTAKRFRDVINSRYHKDAVLLLPSGGTLPLDSDELIPLDLLPTKETLKADLTNAQRPIQVHRDEITATSPSVHGSIVSSSPDNEVSVIIYGGLELPYKVYEAILDTFKHKEEFLVTVSTKTVPVHSLLDLITVTRGNPDEVITLPNGMHVKSTTFRGVVNEHQQNDIFLRIPSGEIVPLSKGKNYIPANDSAMEPGDQATSKEGSVTLISGERIPFHVYELIICSSVSGQPISVLRPDGSIRIAKTLPELWELFYGHPEYLIKLQDGSLVSADTYGNAVSSRKENADVVQRLSGCAGNGFETASLGSAQATIILPTGERVPYRVYESIIDSFLTRTPLKTTTSQSQVVHAYPLVELMLVTNHRPSAEVHLPNGSVTSARIYRDAVISFTQGGAELQYPSGRVEPIGPYFRRPVDTQSDNTGNEAPCEDCKFVRITVPGRGVQFILGDGSWDSPRYCRVDCGGGNFRYEPSDSTKGLPCYESLVRPDGKVVYIETLCSMPCGPTSKVIPNSTPENEEGTDEPSEPQTDDVSNDPVEHTPLVETLPCPVETETKPGSKKVVVIDGSGQLHKLDVIQTPCEYQPEIIPSIEPGQVVVIDGDGHLRAVDVGDDPITLYEPSNIAMHQEPSIYKQAKPTVLPDEYLEEIRPSSEVEAEMDPSLDRVEFIDGDGNLHAIEVSLPPSEHDDTPLPYSGPVVIDGDGEMETVDDCPPLFSADSTMESQPSPEVEAEVNSTPEGVLFIDGDGNVHTLNILRHQGHQPEGNQSPDPGQKVVFGGDGVVQTVNAESTLHHAEASEEIPFISSDIEEAEHEMGTVVVIDAEGKTHTLDVPQSPCKYLPEDTPTAVPGQILVIGGDGQLHAVDVGDDAVILQEPSDTVIHKQVPSLDYSEINCHHSPREETVTLISGERIPYPLYKLIICSSVSRGPINVLSPDGGIHMVSSLPELWQLTNKHPEYLVRLEDGSIVTADTYINAVNSPQESTEAIKRLCGGSTVELCQPTAGEEHVTDLRAEEVVVIDGEGNLHSLGVPHPLCEYQHEDTPTAEPGQVLVIDEDGQLHAVDVGDDTIKLLEPSDIVTHEHDPLEEINCHHSPKEEGTVTLISGERIPFPLYELIICSSVSGRPINVISPDSGIHTANSLPELWQLIAKHPEHLVQLEDGSIVTADTYVNAVNSPQESTESIKKLCGGSTFELCQPTAGEEPVTDLGAEEVVVIDGEGNLHSLGVPHPPCEYLPEDTPTAEPGQVLVIDEDGQLHAVGVGDDTSKLLEPSDIVTHEHVPLQEIDCHHSPREETVTLISGERIPFSLYELIICSSVSGRPISVLSPDSAIHTANTLPELRQLIERHPEYLVRLQDGPTVTADTYINALNSPQESTDAIKEFCGASTVELCQPTSGEETGIDSAKQVVVMDGEGNLHALDVPPPCKYLPEDTPTAAPGQVLVIDGDGKLHAVDVGDDIVILHEPSSTLIHKQVPLHETNCHDTLSEESVTLISGERIPFPLYKLIICSSVSGQPISVLSPDGRIHTAHSLPELRQLGNKHPEYLVKLQDGSIVSADTYVNAVNSPQNNTDAIKQFCSPESAELSKPLQEVEADADSDFGHAYAIEGDGLQTVDETNDTQPTSDVKVESHPPPEGVVIDGIGNLHTLDIPKPACDYQPEANPTNEPKKNVVIDGDGQLHTVDFGHNHVTLIGPSGIVTFERPCEDDIPVHLPPQMDTPTSTQQSESSVLAIDENGNIHKIGTDGYIERGSEGGVPINYVSEMEEDASPEAKNLSAGMSDTPPPEEHPINSAEEEEGVPVQTTDENTISPADTNPSYVMNTSVISTEAGESPTVPGQQITDENPNIPAEGEPSSDEISRPATSLGGEKDEDAPSQQDTKQNTSSLGEADPNKTSYSLATNTEVEESPVAPGEQVTDQNANVSADGETSSEEIRPLATSPEAEKKEDAPGQQPTEQYTFSLAEADPNNTANPPATNTEAEGSQVVPGEQATNENPNSSAEAEPSVIMYTPISNTGAEDQDMPSQPTISENTDFALEAEPSYVNKPSTHNSEEEENEKEFVPDQPTTNGNLQSSPEMEPHEVKSPPTLAPEAENPSIAVQFIDENGNIHTVEENKDGIITSTGEHGTPITTIETLAAVEQPEINTLSCSEPSEESPNANDEKCQASEEEKIISPTSSDKRLPTTINADATIHTKKPVIVGSEYVTPAENTFEDDDQPVTVVPLNPTEEEGSSIPNVMTLENENYHTELVSTPPAPVPATAVKSDPDTLQPHHETSMTDHLPDNQTETITEETLGESTIHNDGNSEPHQPPKDPENIMEQRPEPGKVGVMAAPPIPYYPLGFPAHCMHSPSHYECACMKPYIVSSHPEGFYPENFHEPRSPGKAKYKNKIKTKKMYPGVTNYEVLPEIRPTYTPIYDDNSELIYFIRSDLLLRNANKAPDATAFDPMGEEHETHIVPIKPNKVVHDDDGNTFVFPLNSDGTIAFDTESDPLDSVPESESDDVVPTPFSIPEIRDTVPPSSDPGYIIVRSSEGYINYIPRFTAPGREIIFPSGVKHVLPVFPSKFIEPSVPYHAFTTPDGFVYNVPYGRGYDGDVETSTISIEKIDTPDGKTVEVPVETKKRSDGSITTSVIYSTNGKAQYKTIVDVSGEVYSVPISGTTTHHHPNSKAYKTIIDPEGDEFHVPESQLKSSSYKTILDVDGNIYEIPAAIQPVDNLHRAQQRTTPATLESPITENTNTATEVVPAKYRPELYSPYVVPREYPSPFFYHSRPYHINYYDPVMAHFYHNRAFSVEQQKHSQKNPVKGN